MSLNLLEDMLYKVQGIPGEPVLIIQTLLLGIKNQLSMT